MTVTAVDKDPQARTLTITAEFEAGVERVWRLWSEPRQLERWWGPPGHPITVTVHELRPEGRVEFFVAGDEERLQRGWDVVAVEPPHRLEFDLSDPHIPTVRVAVTIAEREDGGTRMTTGFSVPTVEAMDELLAIGFDQGMATAIGQIDAALAPPPA